MAFTAEQLKIFNIGVKLKDKEVLTIIAPAGSGKTFTLVELAKRLPNKKILYLAYNKEIQKEASSKFPKNVFVSTAHSLAFKQLNVSDNYELKEGGDYSAGEIAKLFDDEISNTEAEKVKNLFEKFCNSADLNFSKNAIKKNPLLSFAIKMYSMMLSKKIPITHSFYFKEFQRQQKMLDYEVVLLDEAQDSNPVTLAMFFNLKGAKVLVGDPHQAIYSFRGSVNAIENIDAKYTTYLTKCFRCNPDIIDRANEILSLKGNQNFKIESLANNSVLDIKSRAVITRTNAKIVELLANECLPDTKQDINYILAKPPKDFFDDILKLVDFLRPSKTEGIPKNNYYFKLYKDEETFKEFISKSNDINLKSAFRLVMKYGRFIYKIKAYAQDIYKRRKELKEKGEVINLMTAHASKGLEFDEVYLKDDFPDLKKMREQIYKGERTMAEFNEEINLYYVAVTRAKAVLYDETKSAESI